MKRKILLIVFVFSSMFYSCSEFLDVVPEGTATLDHVFSMRTEAEKYLSTCYSYMPRTGNLSEDPGMWGDGMWTLIKPGRPEFVSPCFDIAMGLQNAKSPLHEKWRHYYIALRDCNIFIENIDRVPDLPDWERDQWIAEVKVLKAYYHFNLLQMYGPIPIIKDNLPVDAPENLVRVSRNTVDECVAHMVSILDEVKDVLLMHVVSTKKDFGHITSPIAYALKAKILVTAASPLFNGNTDQATLKNRDGTVLFNQTVSEQKWLDAVVACEEAIAKCAEAGITLYKYVPTPAYQLSDTINKQLELRNIITDRKSSEIIWGNTQSLAGDIQRIASPRFTYLDAFILKQVLGVPLKLANEFYTSNGVPLNEDKTFNKDFYGLRKGDKANKLYIKQDVETANINFDREPRFYAWLGFDSGIWYGHGKLDDNSDLYWVDGVAGKPQGLALQDDGPVTGYIPKKVVNYENYETSKDGYFTAVYAWPIIRLGDLYLMYAEALNEVNRGDDAIVYLNKIRQRAGLLGVKESWDQFTTNKSYQNQTGLRKIIKRERKIELAFEGHRYWDILRWKDAIDEYKTPIQGWDLKQSKKASYYRPVSLYQQQFVVRDYFWPIKNSDITGNSNLVQNIGW